MKSVSKLIFIGICLLAFAGLSFNAVADSHESPPDKADLWIVHVKTGMAAEFEAAFQAHLEYRAEKGEPRSWNVYTVAIGDDLGSYGIRYCCVDWADVDAYVAWEAEAGTGAHWDANVDQYVKSYEHYYSVIDFENSNWPDGDTDFSLFGVTRWELKLGSFQQMNDAKTKMSSLAKEHGWPRYWSWLSQVGGTGGISIVSPYENFAGMAPPEQSFAEFLIEHMESPEEALGLLNSFSTSFTGSTYTVYRLRDDLSTSSDEE